MDTCGTGTQAAALYGALALSVGILELGILVCAMSYFNLIPPHKVLTYFYSLFGVYVLQAWNYYRDYPNDPWWLKTLVAFVVGLDTFHTALIFHSLWYYTIDLFGQSGKLNNAAWSLASSIYPSGSAVFLTQIFFCFRVWKLTNSVIGTGICFTLTFLRWAFSLSCASMALAVGSFTGLSARYRWGVVITLVDGATADIAIATALCFSLLRSRTAFSGTDKMLDKLVSLTISTGFLSSLIAFAVVLCFLTMSNLAWLALILILMKMFPNCLLASLNERNAMRNPGQAGHSYHVKTDRTGRSEHSRGTENVIQLTTEITVTRDLDPSQKASRDEESEFGYEGTGSSLVKV